MIEVYDQAELGRIISDNDVVVVDFSAPAWCRPCQALHPHLEMADEKSDAVFVMVDVDKAPWAMVDFGIQSVPTVMLYRDGVYVKNLQERTAVKLLKEME